MKKIITLILSAGIFTATYAQGYRNYGEKNNHYSTKHYARNNDNYHHGNMARFKAYQKQNQFEKIDREYRYKVLAIQHNRYMTNRQKRLSIRDAKNERNYKMKMISHNSYEYAESNYGKNYRR